MDYNIFDVLIVGSGLYLIYAAIAMKRTGKVPGVMLSKGVDVKKTADVSGFIKDAFWKTIVIGIVSVLAGGIGLYSNYNAGLGWLYTAVIPVYAVALMLYGYLMVKAQKKYLQI